MLRKVIGNMGVSRDVLPLHLYSFYGITDYNLEKFSVTFKIVIDFWIYLCYPVYNKIRLTNPSTVNGYQNTMPVYRTLLWEQCRILNEGR